MTEWRALSWLPSYEISENGLVRRCVAASSYPAGMILQGTVIPKGYRRYNLQVDGKYRALLANRLVCEAWHGPPPSGAHQAAHGDGNPKNDHWSNLRWATPKENEADKRLHGTSQVGERNPAAKLNWALVREIRAAGYSIKLREWSARTGVSMGVIARVRAGEVWREAAHPNPTPTKHRIIGA